MMKEFELIELIKDYFQSPFIGDDAFYNDNLLISKDIMIEGVHFIIDKNFYEIGAKAIISNVSDILAMGGKPEFFFIGLGINSKIKTDDIKIFLNGIKDFSEKYNVIIGGGDISRSEKLIISITIIGKSINIPITRYGAKTGDDIFVIGEFGDSEIGLRIIKEKFTCDNREYFIKKHYIKELYPECVYKLAKENLINSMIDVSDGFLQDLEHILNCSNKSAEIFVRDIPVSKKLINLKKILKDDELFEIVLTSGEEYNLIFTSELKNREKVIKILKYYNVPFAKVGKIIEKTTNKISFKDIKLHIKTKGYSHF